MSRKVSADWSQEVIWDLIPKNAQRMWEKQAMVAAANDLRIQKVVRIITECEIDRTEEFIKEAWLDRFEDRMARYDAVPPSRRSEVYEMALNELILQGVDFRPIDDTTEK